MFFIFRRPKPIEPGWEYFVDFHTFIRPDEVDDLVSPEQHHYGADGVAAMLKEWLLSGALRYFPDPEWGEFWRTPLETRADGGDCEDLAGLAASMLLQGGIPCEVAGGMLYQGGGWGGHAWVEGTDRYGWFLLEATSGDLFRRQRPSAYRPKLFVQPGYYRVA